MRCSFPDGATYTSNQQPEHERTPQIFSDKSRLQGTWGQETFLEDAGKWRQCGNDDLGNDSTQSMLRARLAGHDTQNRAEIALLYVLEIAPSTLST